MDPNNGPSSYVNYATSLKPGSYGVVFAHYASGSGFVVMGLELSNGITEHMDRLMRIEGDIQDIISSDEYITAYHFKGGRTDREKMMIALVRSMSFARNVLLQCVVIWAWSPIFLMVLIPCKIPLRDGHNFILSMSRNSATRLR